jgi:uncharacterized protein
VTRLETVRKKIDEVLAGLDPEFRRAGTIHLYGVSATANLLAQVRGLDPELASVAGMLHDVASFASGDNTDHARRGAERAAKILGEVGGFSPGEIATVTEAISRHSSKAEVDGLFAELLKDADVLDHHLFDPKGRTEPREIARLAALKTELGMNGRGKE